MQKPTLTIKRVYDPTNQTAVEYYDTKGAKDIEERKVTQFTSFPATILFCLLTIR
jgi:hypothetical protein